MKKEDVWHFVRLGLSIAVFVAILIELYKKYSWELTAFNIWIGLCLISFFIVLWVTVSIYLKNEQTWKRNIK